MYQFVQAICYFIEGDRYERQIVGSQGLAELLPLTPVPSEVLTKGLRQALNRERSNVGRRAYADRVKAILKERRTAGVARGLADDLAAFTTGGMHDELGWNDIALHACRVLATHEKVVFVSRSDLEFGAAQLDYARDEGFRLVLVPHNIADRIGNLTDFEGEPLYDLDGYRDAWNDSFTFIFVDPARLTPDERQVYSLTGPLLAALGVVPTRIGVSEILISETMRLNSIGHKFSASTNQLPNASSSAATNSPHPPTSAAPFCTNSRTPAPAQPTAHSRSRARSPSSSAHWQWRCCAIPVGSHSSPFPGHGRPPNGTR
ncbi:hypothetical protein [Nocardia araoensis]|uniref:hypothetical protein n=1 Tax=Nocardia araoensis TaxID=228600 RepID=UPI0012F6F980|nr:hypothetical protein [Nocardia araoensis]